MVPLFPEKTDALELSEPPIPKQRVVGLNRLLWRRN